MTAGAAVVGMMERSSTRLRARVSMLEMGLFGFMVKMGRPGASMRLLNRAGPAQA